MAPALCRVDSTDVGILGMVEHDLGFLLLQLGFVKQIVSETGGDSVSVETCEQPRISGRREESVSSVLEKFRDLNLDDTMESVGGDDKDGLIVTLVQQVKDLEKKLKERKDWAQKKAMQVSQKERSQIECIRISEESKKEKKCLKKLLAWEKQKLKLQDEIIAEKEKTKALYNALAQITQDEKRKGGRNIKKRSKLWLNWRKNKAGSERRVTSSSTNLHRTTSKLEGSYESEANNDRECIICMKDEVSVVFLPCAHQVVCGSCSDSFFSGNNNGGNKVTCPCCRSLVQQRIHIFGATS
ncbi:hypothetical protein HID58_018627 [Brassica napus]|uniref:RING-type domain-containing protein n=1 Tax=Brassica napus TaxID=3708 RepID=A0ABQ8DAG4_BRANA|nr:hypothetical protein HID58_018627 [Brassica napus]